MQSYQAEFLRFAMDEEVLLFGEFTLKSGRLSPYFFNAGRFNTGAGLARLASFYARAIDASDLEFDMLYGPAYKGIPLVAAIATQLYNELGRDVPWSFNRKEAKDHGEAGLIVGSPLVGNVLIVDDAISAGTSVRESVGIINAAGANPMGVAIALDRQERGQGTLSASQETAEQFSLQVLSIATLNDLIALFEGDAKHAPELERIQAYRGQYGV